MSNSTKKATSPLLPPLWRERVDVVGKVAEDLCLRSAVVGGCVRDLFLGFVPRDWDVVVEGQAALLVQRAAKALSARVVEHPRFMTFTLHFADGTHLDVATARAESYPTPGVLPVVRPATLAEDARRRDFTANALYLQLSFEPGVLLDPTGGQADMNAGVLRVLHDQSFVDDPTRLFRAARYSSRYGWAVEGKTLDLIYRAVAEDSPKSVSLVRLRHELFRILEEENPAPALRVTWEWGLWKYWDPTWEFNDTQIEKVKAAPRQSPPLQRLAVFLGPNPVTVAATLKRFSAPIELRKSVLGFLGGER
ncbi:MAG: CCA tRNA nucleotidyltransferase [Elusimicrobia bacterium]|nr:CCA tRNA nucleotidyltransferase [Elusimicrobiota bacterium]